MRSRSEESAPACVDYWPGWVDDHQSLFDWLREEISWEQHEITVFGRAMPIPRLTAWVGDAAYRYSGIVNQPIPWTAALTGLRERLEQQVGAGFNSCLVNLYRDGSDSMGFHSDDEPELGPEPTIASISLGSRRRFVLRHRVSGERWSWDLGAGDLLVMRNESQQDYGHAVPKTAREVGPRMNLTFRQFHA